MPNLENLRKQAKQYLRWHRQRYYPVAFLIRSTLPRFAFLSDPDILDAPFRLADAQELVARKMGYESWTTLHAGIEAMDDQASKSPSAPGALSAEPMIFVTDIKASCDFYSEKLGFSVAFIYGEPPFYGQVRRDAARLNLRWVAAPVINPGLRDSEDLLSAAVTLDDAKPLFLEYQAVGVDFHQTLRTEPWGARTFIVRDPDGNLILFAGSAD
jgi:catechol 2,3-dioxygenase-like lactoylglutathione lyase family enzyme